MLEESRLPLVHRIPVASITVGKAREIGEDEEVALDQKTQHRYIHTVMDMQS